MGTSIIQGGWRNSFRQLNGKIKIHYEARTDEPDKNLKTTLAKAVGEIQQRCPSSKILPTRMLTQGQMILLERRETDSKCDSMIEFIIVLKNDFLNRPSIERHENF